jgi:O-antigen/teichoic acid export membrane protein
LKASPAVLSTAQILQSPSGDAAAEKTVWQKLSSFAPGNHVLALLDQVVVSGTSFLTLIAVARFTDTAQLGAFAIANSVLGVSIAIQHSLVSQPYTIQRHDQQAIREGRAFCSLVQSGLLSGIGVFLLMSAACALAIWGASGDLVQTVMALAALIPFVMAKELVREFSFAHLRLAHALILDAIAASIQLAMLYWIALMGGVSVFAAIEAIGLSCGTVAIVWLYMSRADFAFRAGSFQILFRQSWQLGKWLTLSRIAVLVQGYAAYWLSATIAGAAVTGVYAACMSVISLANPLLLGFYNFLAPRSVLTWKNEGSAGLLGCGIRDTVLLGTVMGSFCIFIAFGGDAAMKLLYPAAEYRGHGLVLTILAIGAFISSVGIPASNALATMERPRPIALVTGVSALFSLTLVWWLLTEWGLVGVACGILAGNLVWTLGRWFAFAMLLRELRNGCVTDKQWFRASQ